MAKTKEELGNALKQLTHEKPFDKISVSDITTKCDLNRQTFYYHFQDKYECLEWVYRHDCLLPLNNEMTYKNWDKCIEKMLIIMCEDKDFYMHSIKDSPQIFMDLFAKITTNLFRTMIESYESIHVNQKNELNKEFMSEFLTMGIMGMIMNWVGKGMKISPLLFSEQLKKMADRMREMREE